MATTSDFSRGIISFTVVHTLAVNKWFWKLKSKEGIPNWVGSSLDFGQLFPHMTGTYVPWYRGHTTQFPICSTKDVMNWTSLVGKYTKHGTLRTMWSIISRPLLPGYFPVMLEADKLKRLAPVSVQMAWTNIFFPTPPGPASNKAFTKGAFSWTVWEPVKSHKALLLLSFKSVIKVMELFSLFFFFTVNNLQFEFMASLIWYKCSWVQFCITRVVTVAHLNPRL